MGGDRRIIGLSILFAVLLGWVLVNSYGWLFAVPISAGIWLGGTWVGREIVKADPYALDIFVRHIRYRKYYPPTAKHDVPVPPVKDFI